ncbi:hypothetical protein D3C72_1865020 [compost metagenome]
MAFGQRPGGFFRGRVGGQRLALVHDVVAAIERHDLEGAVTGVVGPAFHDDASLLLMVVDMARRGRLSSIKCSSILN